MLYEVITIKGDGDGHITGWSESQAAIKAGDKRPILVVTSQRVADYPDIPTAIELAAAGKKGMLDVITSYSIHYTKLYEVTDEIHPESHQGVDEDVRELLEPPVRQPVLAPHANHYDRGEGDRDSYNFV